MRHIFILAALLCVSCGTQLPSIKPYKLDIQQGNVVTSKMLLQLRPGMTKSQVRFIMGTPLVQDSFHGNRWDYVYQMRENGKIKEQRRVILDFENELLKSVRGDVVPAGSELAKETETPAVSGTRVVPPVKAEKEKSLLDKLKFWADDEAKAETVAPVKQPLKQNTESATPAAVIPAATPPAGELQQDAVKVQPEQAPSMLAVPIAVPEVDNAAKAVAVQPAESVPSTPAAETALPQPEIASAPTVVEPKQIEPVVSEPVPAAPIAPLVVPAQTESAISAEPSSVAETPALLPEPAPPVNPYHYQSPAGMQFDRRLQIEEEESPPVVEPSGSRTGNKVAPQPKPLPPETEPSFFDRMLEQIGF